MTFRSKHGVYQLAVMWQGVRAKRYALARKAFEEGKLELAKMWQERAARAHNTVQYYIAIGARRIPIKNP